jgi:carotene biosynthesis associated membrane protein
LLLRSSAGPDGPDRRVFLAAFAVFVGAILFSLAGSALLTLAPAQAGVALGWIAQHLGLAYDDLVKGPTWAYMALLPVLALALYWRELGPARSFAFLAWGAAVGAAAELVGTTTGFPFGHYAYGEWLGAKIAGHVPYFIPPSWYALSIVSLDLARRMRLSLAGRVLTAAAFMVLWDVALDPAMNHAFPFWSYRADGVYFGMPLVNWAGWLLTSAVIVLGYETFLGGLAPAPDRFVRRWGPRLYAANVLFPAAICLLFGAPLAGAFGAAALAAVLGVVRRAERRGAQPAAVAAPA